MTSSWNEGNLELNTLDGSTSTVDESARLGVEKGLVRRRPRTTERRSTVRLPLELDVAVEGAAHRFGASTTDLSPGGMFLSTPVAIPVGAEVMLGFELPNGVWLDVVGLVCWRRARHDNELEPGLGIGFFCLAPEAKVTLQQFCAVREPLYSYIEEAAKTDSIDDLEIPGDFAGMPPVSATYKVSGR